MSSWDHTVDAVVVGSGNGGLTAALTCYEQGLKDVLVVEKGELYGGTSGQSGGGIWIPANHYALAEGAQDSAEEAREYLRHTLPEGVVDDAMLDQYLAPNTFWNSKNYLIKRKTLKNRNHSKGMNEKLARKSKIVKESYFCMNVQHK